MSTSAFDRAETALSAAFAKTAARVRRRGPGRWNLVLENSGRLGAEAVLENGWCDITAHPRGSPCEPAGMWQRLWDLLALNATFAPGVRAFLSPAAGSVCLACDILAGEDAAIAAALEQAARGLEAASRSLAWLASTGAVRAPDPAALEEGSAGAAAERLDALGASLAAAGWEPAAAAHGRFSVKLEAPGRVFHARAAPRPGAGAIIFVELAEPPPASQPESRAALALLLLTAAAAVRLARPFRTAADAAGAGFEVACASEPTPEWCGHALSALSVACGVCGAEAQVFQDERIAREFLAARGWTREDRSQAPGRCP